MSKFNNSSALLSRRLNRYRINLQARYLKPNQLSSMSIRGCNKILMNSMVVTRVLPNNKTSGDNPQPGYL